MTHCDLNQVEQGRRREIAEHTRKMLLRNLPIEDQDETSLTASYRDYYLQISFSELHPLMVFCLAKALKAPGSQRQLQLTNELNMGSKSFQKYSDAIHEENDMWNLMSRRMGPPYAAFVVIIECGMLLMVPFGGMFFLKGSLTASALLLFVYVGSLYLTEIRPLQELGTNFANVLNAITKTEEILDIPVYEGGTDFPTKHDIELRDVRFSYDGKTDVLEHCSIQIKDGERMALVGRSGAGKSTVIELISRFYDANEGEVLIGGKNVKELNYETILKNVAIVFQKTFLTRDSVLENIRMGSNASLEEVRRQERHRLMILSCLCRMVMIQRLAASVPVSLVVRSSESLSQGQS